MLPFQGVNMAGAHILTQGVAIGLSYIALSALIGYLSHKTGRGLRKFYTIYIYDD
jgi:hypothetical protein